MDQFPYIITPLDKCGFGLHPPIAGTTLPGGGEGEGEINVKNAFSEHAELRATRLSQARHTPSLSFPQYSIVGTLRRFEDVFNQGTIIPRRAIQVLSDQSAVSSPDETRLEIRPSLSSPNLLIRTTIGITSAAPSVVVPECTTLQMRARDSNSATLRSE